ncbi:hypothetical protein PG990_011496 [Apiospora arundinis]
MFGLLKRALSASLSIVFTPSYSVDVITTSVFTSATSLSLDDIPRFETLPYVEEHSTTNIQEVPSWVPDYTRDLINVQLIRIRGPMHGVSFDPYPLEAASCSGRVSGGEFIVPGARFDHIVEVCHPMVDIIEEHGVHGFLELCQGASSEYFPRYSKPGELLWWNIVADSFQWVPLPTALGQRFRYRISVHLALDFTIGSILHPEEEETVSRLDLNEAEVMESLALLGQLRKAGPTLGELCITSMDDVVQQGRSMYNPYHQFFVHRDSMPDTAEGDPTTPMSARSPSSYGRENGSYMLMGEAYEHGFMNGEMKDLGSRDELPLFQTGIAEGGRWLEVEATVTGADWPSGPETPRPRPPNGQTSNF